MAFSFLAVWAVAALGLLLRKPLALGVLVFIEFLALFGWVDDPGEWGRFVVQVALVLLLISPAMERYVERTVPAQPPPRNTSFFFLLAVVALSLSGAAAAPLGSLRAIPLFSLAVLTALMWLGISRVATADTEVPH